MSALSIPQACQAIGIGRTKLYALINDGLLSAKKLGKRTFIMRDELDRFFAALPEYNKGGVQ